MIIDETAGSGGDLLPWMFRKFKLGPLVGRRTWGGLVGILGFPVLMDGGAVTAPTWPSSPRRAGWSRTSESRPTSRSSKTRPPWPPARTRSSTGPSRSSSRPWPRTRLPRPATPTVPGPGPREGRRASKGGAGGGIDGTGEFHAKTQRRTQRRQEDMRWFERRDLGQGLRPLPSLADAKAVRKVGKRASIGFLAKNELPLRLAQVPPGARSASRIKRSRSRSQTRRSDRNFR